MMIRAVIFDFGNVICRFDVQQILKNLSQLSGKTLNELQEMLPLFSRIAHQYESGALTSNEFYARFLATGRLSIERFQFIKAYSDIFMPIPTTFDLIRKLKLQFKLGLLSNTSEWHFEHGIKTTQVFNLFDAVSLSFQVKAMKPARAMYDDVLTKLKVNPEEAVYIDDIIENVEAGQRIGLKGIHYQSHQSLVDSLQRIGILVDILP